jgi:hypothetical protein
MEMERTDIEAIERKLLAVRRSDPAGTSTQVALDTKELDIVLAALQALIETEIGPEVSPDIGTDVGSG